MKNILIILITAFAAYYFWPSSAPSDLDSTSYEDEEYEEVDEPAEEPTPPPKVQKLVKKIPKPAIIEPQPKAPVKAKPVKVIAAASKPTANEWYKSKEPPKDIAFKVDKKGNAVAFGDIYLGRVQKGIKGYAKTKAKPVQLWDSTEIPYQIAPDIPKDQKEIILATLNYFSENTNLSFIQHNGSHKDLIVFLKGDKHCYSYLGKVGGAQPIYLSANCGANEIAHELMHAIGFIHEHNRVDRGQYVKIHWDNVQKDFENQFALAPKEFMMDTLAGFPFSYNSRMLYDPHSFAKNRAKPTISSTSDKKMILPGTILSPDDINRINNTY